METDNDLPIPSFRRAAGTRVRRRVYVAVIVAASLYLLGLLYWPLSANTYQTIAEVTVQIDTPVMPASGRTGASLSVVDSTTVASEAEVRMHQILRQCLSDESLASTIQQATFRGAPTPDQSGVAPLQVAEVRKHLQVGLSASGNPAQTLKWIRVVWTGRRSSETERLVDVLAQEIASRFARDIRVDSIQLKLEERFDQIAQQQSTQATQLIDLISESKRQMNRHRLTLLALQQQLAHVQIGDAPQTLAIQSQVEDIRQQVINSDAHLLSLLRQQVMNHFEVDASDGLVQHIERLIQDRQATLAKIEQAVDASSQANGAAMQVSHPTSPPDARVRSNPFFTASVQVNREQTNNTQLREANELLTELQAQPLEQSLYEMQAILESASRQKIPVLPVASLMQREGSLYRVVQIRPATTGAPLDLVPSQTWAFGLAMIALMVGVAFTLQNNPESLARSVFRPTQLATYLGIDHLGTIKTGRQAPNLLDQGVRLFGRRVFQAAEILVLVSCVGILMAMVWDAELPSLMFSNPLEGVCRAFWTLLGR